MTKQRCTHCNTDSLRVEYQPRERRDEDGNWYDAGGFHIATCDNPDCCVHGHTVTHEDHASLKQCYKRDSA